jgi:hypothetical protein
MAESLLDISPPPVEVLATKWHLSVAMKSSFLAFVAALAASPTLAAQDGYPPGLFEHSPVVPGPGDSADPPDSQGQPPDAAGPADGNGSLDDYCASIASRTFHSLAEVKRAHAQCDPAQGDAAPPDQ